MGFTMKQPSLLKPSLNLRASGWIGLFGTGFVLALGGCSNDQNSQASASLLPKEVQAIVFLQRAPRNSDGNVFSYTTYVPGGRLVKLEPPAANGKLTVLTADPAFANADIMSWD